MRKILTGALICFVLFTVTGFFIVPPILKSVLISKLSEKLHREVTIQKVKVNPFVLSVDINGFAAKKRDNSGMFVSFNELYMNLQAVSVWKGGLILKEIKIDRPHINIIRNEDGTYNFSDLLEERKRKSTAESKPLRYSLNNIQILNGSVDFLDGPKHTKHKARDVVIKIPFISDLPYYADIFVQPLFEAKLNDTPVSFKGKSKPFSDSLETSLDINVKDFDIPYYLAYLPVRLNVKVLSGLMDTRATIGYTQHRNRPPQIKLSGDVTFKKIRVTDGKGLPLLNLPFLEIGIADSEIVSRNIHLSRISLQSPEIYVTRDSAGKMNIQSLIERERSAKTGRESPKSDASFVLRVDETKLDGGMLSFTDYFKDSSFKTELGAVNLRVERFSNVRDEKATFSLTMKTEANEVLAVAGNLSVLPLASEGTVEFKKIALRKYSPYYRENILLNVEDGTLDLMTRYKFVSDEKAPVMQLAGLEAVLNSLRLKQEDDKHDVVSIPLMTVKETGVDVRGKEVHIEDLYSQKGVINVKRFSNGKWNLGSLIKEGEWSLRNLLKKSPVHAGENQQTKQGVAEKPWQITVKNLIAENYGIKLEDAQPSEPVTIVVDRIKLQEENLSTVPNTKAKVFLSCRINKTGSVFLGGSFGRNPVSGNLKVNVKTVDVVPLQPYFTDKVKIIVTDGDISSKGNLVFRSSKTAGVQATYKGEASLTKFASVDRANAEDFLKWDSLHFDGINAGYAPLRLSIDNVALTDFYSRLIINKDGSLNLQGILGEQGDKENPPAAAASGKPASGSVADVSASAFGNKPPPMPRSPGAERKMSGMGEAAISRAQKTGKLITIDAVTLQGGTINFTDRHIEPNYTANLLEIGGRVSGLSSEENKFADVDLKGKLEDYAPLEITGRMNPLRDDLFVDLNVDFKDMDLSPVSPYSAKYAGYTIQKGRLALKLKYLIVKKKLDAQNHILLDQFTFGDKVESPDATKLPVKFAVALLKNRKGEINLDIPVSGNIDDPKFSLGRIIVKIIVNLLVKAATSPFKLLGALFGHGEELSYVQFDYGRDVLSQAAIKKLDALVKALSDRPALKLEVEGHVDKEKDKEALRQYLFEKKIKAQKLKEMVKKGVPAVPMDEIQIGKDEYAKYLKMAYKAEKFPKPRNILGIAKNLPAPEMEKLMLTNLKVGDDELRQLASQRALRIKEYVIKSGQVSPDRVFLLEPKSLEPETKEKIGDSRVDFKLK